VLGLFLTEIYLSRTGKRLRFPLRRPHRMTTPAPSGPSALPSAATRPADSPTDTTATTATTAADPSSEEAPEAERRRSRFAKAKKR
jgi:hypothetical protein